MVLNMAKHPNQEDNQGFSGSLKATGGENSNDIGDLLFN